MAKLAGVGVGTASRVLNNHPNVSQEKRELVLKAMKELGYRPNALGRNLRMQSTKTIGVILMDIANPFFSTVLKGLEDEIAKSDYSVILSDLSWHSDCLEQRINTLVDKKVDGLIYLGSYIDDEKIKLFNVDQIPTVFISTSILVKDAEYNNKFGYVNIDNEQAAYDAVKYLIDSGHTRIAFISGEANDPNTSIPREIGYKKALIEAGVEIDERRMIDGGFSFESGYHAMKRLLENNQDQLPTAVFCICDSVAIGASKAILDAGLKIPRDISVVGFDGIENGKFYHPSITTIEQPRYKMGQEGIKLIMNMFEKKSEISYKKLLNYKLIIRESSRSIT